MLILTRKLDESIMIGNDIEVKVVKVSGSQVHLGIVAPKNVAVYRHELFEQVMNENKNAVQNTATNIESLGNSLAKFKNILDKKKSKDQ
ncbi:MAG: carbon storage regulator CsrA [Lentisphaerales bacterium]|nr:carbon storage regulator CsrA [Lentisphaerales bacterium]